MELMQVPVSTPSRLMHEFDIFQTTVDNPYNVSSSADVQRFRGHFPHLLNFFHSSDTVAGDDGQTTIACSIMWKLRHPLSVPKSGTTRRP